MHGSAAVWAGCCSGDVTAVRRREANSSAVHATNCCLSSLEYHAASLVASNPAPLSQALTATASNNVVLPNTRQERTARQGRDSFTACSHNLCMQLQLLLPCSACVSCGSSPVDCCTLSYARNAVSSCRITLHVCCMSPGTLTHIPGPAKAICSC